MPHAAQAAPSLGMTYQLRHFLVQAMTLLVPGRKTVAVTYEHPNIDAADDLVVEYGDGGVYDAHQGLSLSHDCYQVKFHLSPDGEVRAMDLADPSWIGTKQSLIARFAGSWRKLRDGGHRVRLNFVTTWQVPNGDALRDLLRQGRLDVEKLLDPHASAKVRGVADAWRKEAAFDRDEELRAFLATLHVRAGAPPLDELMYTLVQLTGAVGMRPPDLAKPQNDYDALVRQHLEAGRPRRFERAELETLLEQAGLREKPPIAFASTVSVCSFDPWGPLPPESTTAVLVDLRDLFVGRTPRHAGVWTNDAVARLRDLPKKLSHVPQPLLVAIDAHLSVAFAAGALFAKSGVQVLLRQRRRANLELWDPALAGPTETVGATLQAGEVGAPLAVAISVTRDAAADAHAFLAAELPTAGFLDLRVAIGQDAVRDGAHATALAAAIDAEIGRVARLQRPRSVHVFPACPWSLAFLLGQRAADWGQTTVYEFDFGGHERKYSPGLTIPFLPAMV